MTNTNGWEAFGRDVTAYAGQTVRFGFSHSAVNAGGIIGPDNANGWFVDDVRIGLDADTDTIPDVGDNCILVDNSDQRDTNRDGFGNACDPDFNGNGIVDSNDAAIFISTFGSVVDPDQDLNGNGVVDSNDAAIFISMKRPTGRQGLSCAPTANTRCLQTMLSWNGSGRMSKRLSSF